MQTARLENGWRTLATVIVTTLLAMVFSTQTVFAQSSLLDTKNCGKIVTAPIIAPEADDLEALVFGYDTPYPSIIGVVLNPEDGMNITFNGEPGKKIDEENANSWHAVFPGQTEVEVRSSTGPDFSGFTYLAKLENFVRVDESLGDPSTVANVYEMLRFELEATEEKIKVCVLGGFSTGGNIASVTYQLIANNQIVDTFTLDDQDTEVVDLIELNAEVQIGQKISLIVSTLEQETQLRENYYLVGYSFQGARPVDSDGDGLPDPDDEDDQSPRSCSVNGGLTNVPYIVGSELEINLQYDGSCGEWAFIKIAPYSELNIAVGNDEEFQENGETCIEFNRNQYEIYCKLTTFKQFRINITLLKEGNFTLFSALSYEEDAFRYWSENITVSKRITITIVLLPLIMR